MTPAEEARFIELWSQGLTTDAIAEALGVPKGTARSRAYTLQQQGKIATRPRGGPHARRVVQARQTGEHPPSTVHRPPEDRPPSTVDPAPAPVDQLRTDLTTALTTALQPVLARLEALERGLAQRPGEGPPSTVHPETVDRPPSTGDPDTWELKQLKHSVRWTIHVPQALQEEIKRRAAARGRHPSLLVQEALARWLAEGGHR
jgi:DNA-binding transcriptional MocR family regulator